jgi:hypothetical protein
MRDYLITDLPRQAIIHILTPISQEIDLSSHLLPSILSHCGKHSSLHQIAIRQRNSSTFDTVACADLLPSFKDIGLHLPTSSHTLLCGRVHYFIFHEHCRNTSSTLGPLEFTGTYSCRLPILLLYNFLASLQRSTIALRHGCPSHTR